MPRDAFITTFVCNRLLCILHILGGRCRSDIIPSVVESIAILVIWLNNSSNFSVHVNMGFMVAVRVTNRIVAISLFVLFRKPF